MKPCTVWRGVSRPNESGIGVLADSSLVLPPIPNALASAANALLGNNALNSITSKNKIAISGILMVEYGEDNSGLGIIGIRRYLIDKTNLLAL